MRIYGPSAKMPSSELDREKEVVEMLRSGEWKIYSSPESCAPGYSHLLLRRARGLGQGGHALKLGIYPDKEIRETKARLRLKAE